MRRFNAGYNGAYHTTKLKSTGTNKLPGVAQRDLEAGFLHKKSQQTALKNT